MIVNYKNRPLRRVVRRRQSNRAFEQSCKRKAAAYTDAPKRRVTDKPVPSVSR